MNINEAQLMARYKRLYETDPTTLTNEQLATDAHTLLASFETNLAWIQEAEARDGIPSDSAREEAGDAAFRLAELHLELRDRLSRHEEGIRALEETGLVTRQ